MTKRPDQRKIERRRLKRAAKKKRLRQEEAERLRVERTVKPRPPKETTSPGQAPKETDSLSQRRALLCEKAVIDAVDLLDQLSSAARAGREDLKQLDTTAATKGALKSLVAQISDISHQLVARHRRLDRDLDRVVRVGVVYSFEMPDGHKYIGQSTRDPEQRRREHFSKSETSDLPVHRAISYWVRQGRENDIIFRVEEHVEGHNQEDLDRAEKRWIKNKGTLNVMLRNHVATLYPRANEPWQH